MQALEGDSTKMNSRMWHHSIKQKSKKEVWKRKSPGVRVEYKANTRKGFGVEEVHPLGTKYRE